MKKLFLLLAFLGTVLSTYAQTNAVDQQQDSTINVIAYFCKGDTVKYTLTNQKFKVEKKDTTWEANYTEDFSIAVLDSTSKGYRIELQYLDFDFSQNPQKKFDIEGEIQKLVSKDFKGMKAIFQTDEYGQVTKVENWMKLRDQICKITDKAVDEVFELKSLPKEMRDSFLQVLPKENLKATLRLAFSDQESVKQSFDELILLLSNHGYSFAIGEKKEEEKEGNISNTVTTTAGYIQVEDKDVDTDGDYLVIHQKNISMPFKDALSLAGGVEAATLMFGDKYKDMAKKGMTKALEEIKEDILVKTIQSSEYWYNGWPKTIVSASETSVSNHKKIELKTIEWSSFSLKSGVGTDDSASDTKKM